MRCLRPSVSDRLLRGAVTALAVLGGTATADVPRRMSFQGQLAGYGDISVHVEVEFWTAFSGGTSLFYEDHGLVALDDGVFALTIGSVAGTVPDSALDSAEVWLELTVEGTALPRTRLLSVPWAVKAISAEQLLIPGTFTPAVTVNAGGNVGVNSKVEIGKASDKGYLNLLQADGEHGIELDGETAEGGGLLTLRGQTDPSVRFYGADWDGDGGSLLEMNYAGNAAVRVDAHQPSSGGGGAALSLYNGAGLDTVYLDADSSDSAYLRLKDAGGSAGITLSAADGKITCGSVGVISGVEIAQVDNKGYINLLQQDGDHGVTLGAETFTGGGLITVRGVTDTSLLIWGADSDENGGSLLEMKYNGNAAIKLDAYQSGSGGAVMSMWNSAGVDTVYFDADVNNAAQLTLKNASNVGTVTLSGGDGTVTCQVLNVTGADVAERFPVTDRVEPGMVVEIDPDHAGQLRLARSAYSPRVAGIVSGAGDLPAGTILGNLPGHEDAPPIALSGRVWTWCDASERPIEPGDRLTTSATAGHAMKAIDMERADGATLGKAMTRLERGRGLVLVLVRPQ